MGVPHGTARRPDARPAEPPEGAVREPPEEAGEEPGGEEHAREDVMRLLSEHVPLTLLADLAQPAGPDSPDILEDEGLPDVAWWEPTSDESH